jgi:hypothetical protein
VRQKIGSANYHRHEYLHENQAPIIFDRAAFGASRHAGNIRAEFERRLREY